MEKPVGSVALLWEANMKRIRLLFLTFSIVFLFTGCYDGYHVIERYPSYKSDAWYCEEIDFSFRYEALESGRRKVLPSRLKVGEKVYNVAVVFNTDYWHMVSDNGDLNVAEDELLLSGTWSYKEETLVLNITADKLFDEKYNEFVFVPVS